MQENNSKYITRVLSLVFVLLFMFSGCKEKSEPSDNVSSVGNVSSVSSESASSDNISSNDETSSKTEISLDGEYTADYSVSRPADDANEYIYDGNCAILSKNLTGYFDKEAEVLRNEILNTPNTEEYYKIKGQKYYISPAGNDENDGETPETALRTVDGLEGINLKSGDAVLFKRNSVFRITRSISTVDGVIYGSYGVGAKPKIYGCPYNYAKPSFWEPTNKKNIWKTSYSYSDTSVGTIIINHGEEIGYLKNSFDLLEKNSDYYHNATDGIIYLYCDKGNPGKVFKDIEFTSRFNAFEVPKYGQNVVVDNLCIKYCGAFGTRWQSENINVTNCEIGYAGGFYLLNGSVRMGNGVGAWAGVRGMNVSHNWIYQIFDTAISPQGQGNAGFGYKDISYCNNLLEYNAVDFEWFDAEGTVWDNFKIEGNIMRFTSLGWGNRIDDDGIRGIEGIIRANTLNQTVTNFSFKNNIIDCPGREIIKWQLSTNDLENFDIGNNKVYVKASYRAYFQNNIDTVMRYLQYTNDIGGGHIKATNQAELEAAWKCFDKSSTSVVKWFD